MSVLTQIFGGILVLVSLADVFLTVLVARYGTSIFSERIFATIWRLVRQLGRFLPEKPRQRLLTFAGPIALVCLFVTWIVLLQLGFALIYWPMLGDRIRAQDGRQTPTDFLTALYLSTDCLTTAVNGDFIPVVPLARAITLVNCLLGLTTITLAVTYLVQLYNALRERNSSALSLHQSTAETGDAAEWLAGLSAGGTFEGGSAEICKVVGDVANNYETYHFYASLLYFHFAEVHYSQARVALIVMDASALARSIIDPAKHPNFVRHGGIEQLGKAGLHIAQDLADVYLPPGELDRCRSTQGSRVETWRRRYLAARRRLADENVTLIADVEAGLADYVSRRSKWEAYVHAFAHYLGQSDGDVFASDTESEAHA